MASKTLSVVITGSASGAKQAFDETSTGADRLAAKMAAVGGKLASAGRSLSLGITAPVAAFAAVGFSELAESGKVAAQTEAVIKSTGGAANVTARHVDDLAQSLLDMSGVDDEAIKSGENLLLTFTKVRNEAGKGNDIFDRATVAALDLSVALGKDMTSSALMVGKALNDPIAGLTAMGKAGVQFTASQKETIKALVESGDIMGAQKIILAELETQVGGSAAAYGETMAGQVAKAKESLMNASASMVAVAAPALDVVADAAMGLAGWMEGLDPASKTAIAAFAAIAAAIGPVVWISGKLVTAGGAIVTAWGVMASAAETLYLKSLMAADAIKEMGFVSAIASTGVGATALALGGFAVATAGVALVSYGIVKALDLGRHSFNQWQIAGNRAAQQAVIDAQATEDAYSTLKVKYRDVGDSLAVYTRLSKENGNGLNAQTDHIDAVSGELAKLGVNTKAAAAEFFRLRAESDTYGAALKELEPEHKKFIEQQKIAKAAEEARRQTIHDLATGTSTLATTTETGRQAIADFTNELLAAAGGPLSYQAALQGQARAQEELNTAIAEHGPNSAEAAAAATRLQQAQLGVASAADATDLKFADLVAGIRDGTVAYDDQIRRLQDQITLHPEAAAGYQLEITKLQEAKAAADALPPYKAIKVGVEGGAIDTLVELDRYLRTLTEREWGVVLSLTGPGT